MSTILIGKATISEIASIHLLLKFYERASGQKLIWKNHPSMLTLVSFLSNSSFTARRNLAATL